MTAHDWQDAAACRSIGDPEIFFPPSGPPPKRVFEFCGPCPVRVECLDYAMAAESQTSANLQYRFGIWGGTTPRDRAGMARRRGRAPV